MARPKSEIPWLCQRDGVWYTNWHDPKAGRAKRLSLGTRDAGEAQARFAEFLANKEKFVDTGTPHLTVSQTLDIYLEKHILPKRVATKRATIICGHLKEWFQDKPILEINKAACRGYIEARRTGVLGGSKKRHGRRRAVDSTIRRELGVLAAAANFAEGEQLIGRTATPPTHMPVIETPDLPPKSNHAPKFLTVEELEQVLKWADPDTYNFVMLTYYTASRRTAIEVMHPSQVNLKDGTIDLTHPDETPQQRASPKRRPVVPIPRKLRPVVEQLMIANGQDRYLLGKRKNYYGPFTKLLTELGLGDRKNPHVLRHSRATHLLHQRVSLSDVASILGDTEGTVERTYKGHCPTHLAQAVNDL